MNEVQKCLVCGVPFTQKDDGVWVDPQGVDVIECVDAGSLRNTNPDNILDTVRYNIYISDIRATQGDKGLLQWAEDWYDAQPWEPRHLEFRMKHREMETTACLEWVVPLSSDVFCVEEGHSQFIWDAMRLIRKWWDKDNRA